MADIAHGAFRYVLYHVSYTPTSNLAAYARFQLPTIASGNFTGTASQQLSLSSIGTSISDVWPQIQSINATYATLGDYALSSGTRIRLFVKILIPLYFS